MFSRTYGIEIECYLPEGGTPAEAAAALTRRLGSPVVAETYGHMTRPHWKIITDGSLGDYRRGIEIVSPILSGVAGLADVAKIADALNDYGCTVSRLCGLHVHVGVGYAPIALFRNLFKLYAVYEPVIDGIMPPSRRASANQYCRSMTSAALPDIDRAEDLESLLRLLTLRGDVRYHKLNLAAYRRYNTVEFRQHSGTLDANKIQHWTKFCLRMVEAAHAGRLATNGEAPTAAPQINRAGRNTKAYLVGQLALRPEGFTVEEALAVTGWRQISVPPTLRACGLTFTTQRMGRAVRYYARAAAASTTIDPTLDNLLRLLGCDDAECQYFRTRTVNLGGTIQWAA